jgi:hypothetical protein
VDRFRVDRFREFGACPAKASLLTKASMHYDG